MGTRTIYEWKSNTRVKFSLPKYIHSCINDYIGSKNAWVPFIRCKLGVLGASSGPEDYLLNGYVWDILCQVIRKSLSQVATCFLKSVINSSILATV